MNTIDFTKFKVAKAFQHLDANQGMADGISGGFSSIRYKGKAWTLNHGGKAYPFRRADDNSPLTYIDVVILGVSVGLSKSYFGQDAWTEESANAPICTSLKGDVPDPGTPIPQSKTCGTCPHNEWMTKPGGGRGKECQDHKRMAVLLMPSMTKKMLGAPLLEPVFLKIPPASLRSLKKYSDELQHAGIPFAAVVTRVAFSPDRIFEMSFDLVQALTDAEAPLVLPLMEDTQTKAILGAASQPSLPPPVREPERVDTGLMSAFGRPEPEAPAAQPKSRGRPPKAAATIDNIPTPTPMPKPAPVPDPEPPQMQAEPEGVVDGEGDEWDESDTDLDAAVAKLMGEKMGRMLK